MQPSQVGIFTLSSSTYQGLINLEYKFIQYLLKNKNLNFMDVCFTSNLHYSLQEHRVAIVCSDIQDIIDSLQSHIDGVINPRTYYEEVNEDEKQIVFIFSCQGFEYKGMGEQLYTRFPAFRSAIDQCALVLEGIWGEPINRILWEDDYKDVSLTRYNHPLLISIEYATYKLWLHLGLKPNILIGHSIGEYMAAVAAGIMNFKDALSLVAQRSLLFEKIDSTGSMLSVAVRKEIVADYVESLPKNSAYISAINGPTDTVISGTHDVINDAYKYFENQGFKTKILKAEHGFHSPMMNILLDDFDALLNKIDNYKSPRTPFVSSVTGTYFSPDIKFADYWKEHLTQKVDFYNAITEVFRHDNLQIIELGPDDALSQMGQRCITDIALGARWLSSMLHGEPELEHFMHSVARLYIHGTNFNWQRLYDGTESIELEISLSEYESIKTSNPSSIAISSILKIVRECNNERGKRKLITEYLHEYMLLAINVDIMRDDNINKAIMKFDLDSVGMLRLKQTIDVDFHMNLPIIDIINGLTCAQIIELCLKESQRQRQDADNDYVLYNEIRLPSGVHFEALIFDLDGTLWDSIEYIAEARNEAFVQCGYDLTVTVENIRDSSSYPSKFLLHRIFPDLSPEEILHLNMIYEKILDDKIASSNIIYPGVLNTLKQLQKIYKLYLVSNCRINYMNKFLDKDGIRELFDAAEAIGESQLTKEQCIDDILYRNNMKHACYIGDTIGDYNSAISSGTSYIHAEYGYGDCNAPCVKINSMPDLVFELDRLSDPKNLFNLKRFLPEKSTSRKGLLILYFPIGVLLALIRLPLFFVWQIIGCFIPLTPKATRIYFLAFRLITGCFVKVSGYSVSDKLRDARIIVANHTSTLDSNYWLSLCQSSVVVREGVAKSWVYKLSMRPKNAKVITEKGFLQKLIANLLNSTMPIFIFPEGATTSGKLGLLRFNPMVFATETPILPVSIKITQPFSMALCKLKQGFFSDLFWSLFMPYKRYEIKVLGVQHRKGDESPADFADRVQRLIANDLGIFPTLFTTLDKNELRRKDKL